MKLAKGDGVIAQPRARLKALNGTHALVRGVVEDGADKIDAIAKGAKIKVNTARVAVLELERAGVIQRLGKGRSTRYVIA